MNLKSIILFVKTTPPVVAYTGVKVHCTKAILYE